MTDFDYPPTREFTLAAALDNVEADLADVEQRIEDLKSDEDAQDSAVADAHSDRQELENVMPEIKQAVLDEVQADMLNRF